MRACTRRSLLTSPLIKLQNKKASSCHHSLERILTLRILKSSAAIDLLQQKIQALSTSSTPSKMLRNPTQLAPSPLWKSQRKNKSGMLLRTSKQVPVRTPKKSTTFINRLKLLQVPNQIRSMKSQKPLQWNHRSPLLESKLKRRRLQHQPHQLRKQMQM